MELTHVLVADVFPLELTVYPPNELGHRPRSSTDGKPIVRLRAATLRKLCEREHPELWARYLADGSTPTLEEILSAEEADDAPAMGALLDGDDLGDDATWLALGAVDDVSHEEDPPVEDEEPEREVRLHRSPKGRARWARPVGLAARRAGAC
jgi:hypothetical protein